MNNENKAYRVPGTNVVFSLTRVDSLDPNALKYARDNNLPDNVVLWCHVDDVEVAYYENYDLALARYEQSIADYYGSCARDTELTIAHNAPMPASAYGDEQTCITHEQWQALVYAEANNIINHDTYMLQNSVVELLLANDESLIGDIDNLYTTPDDDDLQADYADEYADYLADYADDANEMSFADYLADECGIVLDDDVQSIFQWILVSDWLADKLEEHGAPVLRAMDCQWWGRTTYGQAWADDGVIQAIAKELLR